MAPGPREAAGLDLKLHVPEWMWGMHRGVPYQDYTLKGGSVLMLETEAHYLRRLGLLEPGERPPPTAYEPEKIIIVSS